MGIVTTVCGGTAVFVAFVAVMLAVFARRSDLKAAAWVPPTPLPKLEVNDRLAKAGERILKGKILGPESLVFRGDELFTGLMDGRIVKINTKTLDVAEFARFNSSCEPFKGGYDEYPPLREPLCGRPLGLRFDPDGRLLVAESYHGIHRLSADGKERQVLVEEVG